MPTSKKRSSPNRLRDTARARGGRGNAVFVDSSAWIAFFSASDGRHADAETGMRRARTECVSLLTTSLVVAEVHRFLAERIFVAEMAGIAKKNIVVDPGFGFGKNTQHNLQLLAQLQRLTELGVPVLAGLSRKKTIGELTGRAEPRERVFGSVAAHLIAAQRGAMLLRVHDVAATVDALKVWNALAAVPMPRLQAKPEIRWPDD